LINGRTKYFDREAIIAWQKYIQASRDEHGNVKRSETAPEELVAAAVRKYFHQFPEDDIDEPKFEGVRKAEKVSYGIARGRPPTHFDRVNARLLARKVAQLIRSKKFGIVVSMDFDDQSIDQEFLKYFRENKYLKFLRLAWQLFLNTIGFGFHKELTNEDRVFRNLSEKNLVRTESFNTVFDRVNKYGLFTSLDAYSPQELAAAGVLIPFNESVSPSPASFLNFFNACFIKTGNLYLGGWPSSSFCGEGMNANSYTLWQVKITSV